MQIYECFAISYLCSKHGPIGERLICRTVSLRVKVGLQMKPLIILLLRCIGLIFPGIGKMTMVHLYAEHNLSTHGKKYRLIFSLNFEKHSEKYRLIFGEIFIL